MLWQILLMVLLALHLAVVISSGAAVAKSVDLIASGGINTRSARRRISCQHEKHLSSTGDDIIEATMRNVSSDFQSHTRRSLLRLQAAADNKNHRQMAAATTDTTAISAGARRRRFIMLLPDGVRNGIASGMATAVVKATLQPFDTIKTLQQMQPPNSPFNPLRTGAEVVRLRGVGALWAGTGVTILGSAPAVAVYFGVFNSAKIRIAAVLPANCRSLAVASAAVIGNTVASVMRVPYEVFKQRLQTGRHRSLAEAVAYSWKYEGAFLGLFSRGKLASQIARDVPYAVITAVSYELLQALVNQYLDRSRDFTVATTAAATATSITSLNNSSSSSSTRSSRSRTYQDALCGSVAGGFSTFLTTPMDVIKTRLMSGTAAYSSVAAAFDSIRREEGTHAFFRGVSSRLMHKIPANGLFYLTYEFFRRLLGVGEHYKLST